MWILLDQWVGSSNRHPASHSTTSFCGFVITSSEKYWLAQLLVLRPFRITCVILISPGADNLVVYLVRDAVCDRPELLLVGRFSCRLPNKASDTPQ
jgi:hypothetical protein